MTIFEDVGEQVRIYVLQNLTSLAEVMIVSGDGQILYKSEGVPQGSAVSVAKLITRSGNVINVNDFAVSHESRYVIFRVSPSIFVVVYTSRVSACTRLKQKIVSMCEDLEEAYKEMSRIKSQQKTISLDTSKLKKSVPLKPTVRAHNLPTRVTLKSEKASVVKKQAAHKLDQSWIRMIHEELEDAKRSMNEIINLAAKIKQGVYMLLEK